MEYLTSQPYNNNTSPNLYDSPPYGAAYRAGTNAVRTSGKDLFSARDSRYPARAGWSR